MKNNINSVIFVLKKSDTHKTVHLSRNTQKNLKEILQTDSDFPWGEDCDEK